jgi:signal peptidase I
MARKPKKVGKNGGRASKGKQAAQLGLGALLFGGITWLTGGFTRENGMEWVKTLLFAGTLALLIRWPLAEPYKIPSGSMEPTLHGDPGFMRGDRVFVNKWVYGVRVPFMNKRLWYGQDPQRWDIVVFKTIEKDTKHKTLIKRIVGLPGERIHIANGKVYVNGEALELPEDMPPIEYTTSVGPYGILTDDHHALVPEGHYLLLGDNSRNSRDGRAWGWMPNEHLVGRAFSIWWPIPHWRDFTGFSQTWWWRTIVSVLGLLVLVRLFLGRSWRMRAPIVEAPLTPGDHLFVNRCVFGWPVPFTNARLSKGRLPKRGEIVLYRPPKSADEQEPLLGRVAALEGERVFLDQGELCINDEPLTGPASLAERTYDSGDGVGPYARSRGKDYSLVPKGHVFVLADNPDTAPDSRSLGWIPREHLVGIASAVWWPIRRWRRIRP